MAKAGKEAERWWTEMGQGQKWTMLRPVRTGQGSTTESSNMVRIEDKTNFLYVPLCPGLISGGVWPF